MTTIIEPDLTTAHTIAEACDTTDVLASLAALKAHLEDRPQEYAVVLGPGVDLIIAVNLADTLRVVRPSLSVILVREEIDTSVLAEALRSGMREVITIREIPELHHVLLRTYTPHEALSSQREERTQKRGKVLTVFSAKGGVGKTTVATNLSAHLAGHGHQVCLLDLDLAFGDVAITLQIFPARTIADAVAMGDDLDTTGLASLLTRVSDGLVALVAPVGPDAKDSISARLVGRILDLLSESYDYVVVDTPPSFDDQVLQAFDHSDQILLVATPDIPALKNLKIALETLHLLNIGNEHLKLVLNRAQPKVGVTAVEVSASLGMSVCAHIPSSADVPASINRGQAIVVSDPRHPASRGIAALAEVCISATSHATPERSDTAQPSPRRSRFRRKAKR